MSLGLPIRSIIVSKGSCPHISGNYRMLFWCFSIYAPVELTFPRVALKTTRVVVLFGNRQVFPKAQHENCVRILPFKNCNSDAYLVSMPCPFGFLLQLFCMCKFGRCASKTTDVCKKSTFIHIAALCIPLPTPHLGHQKVCLFPKIGLFHLP